MAQTDRKTTVYMAGPLFGIAERAHNLQLADLLRTRGYDVVLPQEEATKFFRDGKLDLQAAAENCARQASQSDVVVANLDGPDADSGTSMEVGIALWTKLGVNGDKIDNLSLGHKPLVICVRTDFRTVPEQELDINGMFKLADAIITLPAFCTTRGEISQFYEALAQEINVAISSSLGL